MIREVLVRQRWDSKNGTYQRKIGDGEWETFPWFGPVPFVIRYPNPTGLASGLVTDTPDWVETTEPRPVEIPD